MIFKVIPGLDGAQASYCGIVARYFHIKISSVYCILRGVNWTHLNLPITKLKKTGQRWCRAKLKDIDIPIIRDAITKGHSCSSIARYFKVSGNAINSIKNSKRWRDVA